MPRRTRQPEADRQRLTEAGDNIQERRAEMSRPTETPPGRDAEAADKMSCVYDFNFVEDIALPEVQAEVKT